MRGVISDKLLCLSCIPSTIASKPFSNMISLAESSKQHVADDCSRLTLGILWVVSTDRKDELSALFSAARALNTAGDGHVGTCTLSLFASPSSVSPRSTSLLFHHTVNGEMPKGIRCLRPSSSADSTSLPNGKSETIDDCSDTFIRSTINPAHDDRLDIIKLSKHLFNDDDGETSSSAAEDCGALVGGHTICAHTSRNSSILYLRAAGNS
mmetsp:Transcript_16265/g.24506  ORF Transcript_16265/g.24506 Transcript_16265/m.24506 type:complete len:210 (+) Transcript_16265:753-1382(+)